MEDKGSGFHKAIKTIILVMVIVTLAAPVQIDKGAIAADIPEENTSASYAEELQSRWPLSNSTTADEMRSPFGPRIQTDVGYDFHRGIDLPAAEGTPVVAIMAGVIRLAGDYPFYSQPVVQVRHEYNGTTFYANYQHLSAVHVVEDQIVEAGDILGETGSAPSGFAHLHFAIRKEGVNKRDASHPLTYLPYSDQGPPSLEAYWQEDQLHVNVSVGNQELDLEEIKLSGEGVDFHLNFVELNHATEEPDDLDNDTLIINGVQVTIIPETYSQNQPREYRFLFQFENETGDLEVMVSDVLGQAKVMNISHGPAPPQNFQIQLDPVDVSYDVYLSWDASIDDASISEYAVYRSIDILGPYQEIANITANGSSYYSYIDSDTEDHLSYYYKVNSRDGLGNQMQCGERVAKLTMYLNPGWNVFSVPVVASSNLRTDILASIDDSYSSLQGYFPDESKQWKHWNRGKPPAFNDLESIEYERGYYIYMDTDDYLVIAGEVVENSQIFLIKGWNLVGFTLDQSHTQADLVNGLTGPVIVYGFDSSTGDDILLEPTDLMNPTQGFWIHSEEDQVLII
jgi:hypothetical protein